MSMHHELVSVSNVKKTILFNIPESKVDALIKRQLMTAQQTADMKGFRKGHVPISIIERLYGESLRKQAFDDLKREVFWDAMKTYSMSPAGSVSFKAASGEMMPTELKAGKPLSFEVHFEVFPDVEWKGLEGVEIKEIDPAVTEEEMQEFLTKLKEKEARFMTLDTEDLTIDLDASEPSFVELVVQLNRVDEAREPETLVLKVGEQYPPSFWSFLDKMTAGERREFEWSFDEKHPEKKIPIKVELLAFKQQVFPDEEELASQAGLELEEYLLKVREALGDGKAKQIKDDYINQVYRDILARHVFDVPPSLVEAKIQSIHRFYYTEALQMGQDLDGLSPFFEKNKENFEKDAERILREEYSVASLAKKWSLECEDGDIVPFFTREISQIFAKGSDDEKIRVADYLKKQVLREKVAQKILESARFSKAS